MKAEGQFLCDVYWKYRPMRRRYITNACLSLVNIYQKVCKKLTPPLTPYPSSIIFDSGEVFFGWRGFFYLIKQINLKERETWKICKLFFFQFCFLCLFNVFILKKSLIFFYFCSWKRAYFNVCTKYVCAYVRPLRV